MGKDRGWDYLNSSGNDFDYDKDNDGSWGYKNSDGSGSYYGNDGSWGYTNSDGSGSYYGSDGESEYFDSDNDEDKGYSGSDSGGSLLGVLVGLGVAAFAVSRLANAPGDYSYDDDYYNSEEYQELIRERARQKAEEQRKAEEAQRIKKEQRKEKRRRAWGVLTGKKLEAGISSSGCKEMMLENAVRHFEGQGFYNISTVAIEDLPFERIAKEGTIEGVVINNIDSFEMVTLFPINAKIGITYHKLQRIEFPMTSRTAKKKQIADVVEMLRDAGFVNIEQTVIRDLSIGWIVKDGSVESISIDGRSDFKRGERIRLDAHIVISYHTYKKK